MLFLHYGLNILEGQRLETFNENFFNQTYSIALFNEGELSVFSSNSQAENIVLYHAIHIPSHSSHAVTSDVSMAT
jgi:hypothetical protein